MTPFTKRWGVCLVLFLFPFEFCLAQTGLVRVKVRAALVDQELSVKPVPKLRMKWRSMAAPPDSQALTVSTSFEGTAEFELPAGRYELTTDPVDFRGKTYSWKLEVDVEPPGQSIELSNDNAASTSPAPESSLSAAEDLTARFKQFRNNVVTVWGEGGYGTGFVVDAKGLVLTAEHVVGRSEYLAIQFDEKRKVQARLLAADPEKDVAVLRVNLSVFPEAVVSPLAQPQGERPILAVGERVFTIGNPLMKERSLTSGVVSKVEADTVTSDINFNPGNSGGPLFNSAGLVIGVASYRREADSGAGLSGIIPIAKAFPTLAEARKKMAADAPLAATLLPVEPQDKFPAEPLQNLLNLETMDTKPYFFDVGPFDVGVVTPVVNYYLAHDDLMKAARREAKRAGRAEVDPTVKNRAMKNAQDYPSALYVTARPKRGRMVATRFRSDFHKMRLLCGNKEVEPIHPGRRPRFMQGYGGDVTDRTHEGRYIYPYDAITPQCGQVTLEVYAEKEPQTPHIKILEPLIIERIWADFQAYRDRRSQAGTTATPTPK